MASVPTNTEPEVEKVSRLATAVGEVQTIIKAARRVAALAVVDLSLAVPTATTSIAKPVCDVALNALVPSSTAGRDFMYYRPSAENSALLILCHPSEGPSCCRSLADMWQEELKQANVKYRTVDLCSEDYMGLGSGEELRNALGSADSSTSSRAEMFQSLVEKSRFLIFVHPIYWFDVPSQLKAFLESVLASGFAYRKLPSCWTLNRAVGVLEKLPVVPKLLRRYSAYGFLRDKQVFVTRTQGGPQSGLGIFGHGATTLESSMQFCGAHMSAVDTVAELDDKTHASISENDFPAIRCKIKGHCAQIVGASATKTGSSAHAFAAFAAN